MFVLVFFIIVTLVNIHLHGIAANIKDLVKGTGESLLWEAICSRKKYAEERKLLRLNWYGREGDPCK